MKKLLATFVLFSTIALAGHDTGGGGIGVAINKDTIYLYDFLEAGIEENVYVDTQITDEMRASQIVKANILTSIEVQKMITAKLNEVYRLSPTYAFQLVQTIKDYQWRYVRPGVNSTADLGRTPIRVSLDRPQLAFRDDGQKTVTIDKVNLDKMPSTHQAGLYFHEIIYAQTGGDDSYKARLLTSYLFHPSFQFADFDQLNQRVKLALPNSRLLDHETYRIQTSENYKGSCEKFRSEAAKKAHSGLSFLDEMYKEIMLQVKKGQAVGPTSLSVQHDVSFKAKKEIYLDDKVYTVSQSGAFPLFVYRTKHRTFLSSSTSIYYSLDKKTQLKFEELRSQVLAVINENQTKYSSSCIDTSFLSGLQYISQATLE